MSADHGRWPFFDKDTLPAALFAVATTSASCPADRRSATRPRRARRHLHAADVINIGAYVGEGTLIDSHALVGRAQIDATSTSAPRRRSAASSSRSALPVVIEDDVLVGGNTGVYEGAVVKARAVIAAGTVLTGSTPIYDLPNGRIIKPEAGQPLVVPEGAVVVPGARAVTVGAGKDGGLSLATPVIVKYRDARTDTRTELEQWIR